MAPTPKPPGARRRRNASQAQWRALPAGGREGDPPESATAVEWGEVAQAYWRAIWRSPMATVYAETDVQPLTRLCCLIDERDRYERGGYVAFTSDGDEVHIHNFDGDGEIRQLEDRFGLSPKSRRTLQWEIAQGEESAPVTRLKDVRRLRAVDTSKDSDRETG